MKELFPSVTSGLLYIITVDIIESDKEYDLLQQSFITDLKVLCLRQERFVISYAKRKAFQKEAICFEPFSNGEY